MGAPGWEQVVGYGRVTGYTRLPRARRAGWTSVLVGLLGLSTGGALTVINTASAQTEALTVAASAEACSPVVQYRITPPSDAASDPAAAPHYALWIRTDGVAEWTPAPDEKADELTVLAGDVDTGLAEDATVTLRVQALDATSAPTGDPAYASADVTCDEWQPDETVPTTRAAADITAAELVAPITQGVRIHKSGTRGASDAALDGATMQVWSGTNAAPFTTLHGACVTGDGGIAGVCEVALATLSSNLPAGTRYYVKELTAPAGYEVIPEIGLGSATADLDLTKQPYARGYSNTGVYAPYASPITVTANAVTEVPLTTEAPAGQAAFANRLTNPEFPDRCGLKLGIVFDLSTSIDSGELAQMQTAAKDFVGALDETPSEISLYGFSTTAIDVATLNPRPVADQGIIDDIDDLDDHAGGSTNYDAAFRQIPSGLDAVAFLTDGNPNVYGVNGTGSSSTTFASVEQAVMSANTVKSFGTKIIGVGIGSAASEVNLKTVSGPTLNDDYFLSAGFDTLKATLEQLAKQLCGGSVSVKKLVKVPGSDPVAYQPAAGWQFGSTSAPAESAVVTPGNGITGADGIVNYKYSSGQTLAVTVTETLQPGFTLVPQGAGADKRNAVCTRNGATVPPAQLTDTTNGVTVQVGPTDIVSCEFRNDPNAGTITIKKVTTDDDETTPFGFTSSPALPTDPVGGAFSLVGGGSRVFSTAPGTYSVTEADPGPSGWRLDQLSCTGNGQGGSTDLAQRVATIVLAAGGDVVCTYTNTPRTATVRVRKLVDGQQTAAWTVNAAVPGGQTVRIGAAGTAESVQTPGNGATAFTGLTRVSTTGSTLNLAEVQQAGFTAGEVHCTAAGETQDGAAGAIGLVITPGDDWTCTFNNSLNTATVTVVKELDGTAVADWTFDGQLPDPGSALFRGNGQKTETRTTAGSPDPETVFTIDRIPTGSSSAMTLTEQLQAGYLFDQVECVITNQGNTPLSEVIGGSPNITFDVTAGNEILCTFENSSAPGTITIVKEATPESDQPFEFTSTGGLTPGDTFTLVDGGNPPVDNTAEFTDLAPKTYTVTESDPDEIGWTLDDLECEGSAEFDVASRTVTIDLGPGESLLCTYTNTRNDAHVTVVKKIGDEQVAGWEFDAQLASGAPPAVFAGGGTQTAVTTDGDPAKAALAVEQVPQAGVALTIEELVKPGYTFESVTCVDGDTTVATLDGPADPALVELSLEPGADVTCTFENLLNTAEVTVVKEVDGTAVPGWTFDGELVDPDVARFGNGSTTEQRTTTGDPDPSTTFAIDGVASAADGGTDVDISEQLQAGFAFDQAECVVTNDGDRVVASADGPADDPIVGFAVEPGDEVLCTFENHSAPGTITIAKTTDPTGAATLFSFTAASPLSPSTFDLADGGSEQFTDLLPGTYEVAEDAAGGLGYTLSAIDCDVEGDATVDKDVAAGTVSIELGLDASVLCTYTNTLNTADLTVVKQVDGEQVVGWTFDASLADGPAVFAGVPDPGKQTTLVTAGSPAEATQVVNAVPTPGGVDLTLTEQTQTGYAFQSAVCSVNGVDGTPVTAPSEPVITVTVESGDEVVCTFTNEEVPGTITIVKSTGTSDPREFEFATTGGAPLPATFSLFETPTDDTVTFTDVPSGTYTVTEDDPAPLGWTLTDLTCTEGGTGVVATRTATIELVPAATVTCTFTDEPTTARISVVKLVDGVQTAGWVVDATIDPAETARFGEDGLSASLVSDAAAPAAFPTLTRVSADGSTVLLAEQSQDGFTDGPVSCASDGGVTVDGTTDGEISLSVRPDDAWVCTFENTLNTATVEVVKQVSGSAIAGWTFDGTVTDGPAVFDNGLTTQSKVTANPGPLATFELEQVPEAGAPVTLEEQLQAGYSFAGVTCAAIPDVGDATPIDTGDSTDPIAAIEVFPGQLVRCTFTNNFLPASILLTKTGASSVNAGSDTSFSVLVTNNGQVPLTNVVVTDTLPSPTNYVSAAVVAGNPGSCSEAAKVVTCTLDGTFEVNETSTISIVVNVPATTTALTITNVADVTGDPPSCPPVSVLSGDISTLASECPVTSTDDATVPVITVGGETVVDVPLVLSGSLPFTGPAGLAALKTAAWLLAIGGALSVTQRRRRRTA